MSQATTGSEKASHASVTVDGACAQPPGAGAPRRVGAVGARADTMVRAGGGRREAEGGKRTVEAFGSVGEMVLSAMPRKREVLCVVRGETDESTSYAGVGNARN